jgi:hypothetical protein
LLRRTVFTVPPATRLFAATVPCVETEDSDDCHLRRRMRRRRCSGGTAAVRSYHQPALAGALACVRRGILALCLCNVMRASSLAQCPHTHRSMSTSAKPECLDLPRAAGTSKPPCLVNCAGGSVAYPFGTDPLSFVCLGCCGNCMHQIRRLHQPAAAHLSLGTMARRARSCGRHRAWRNASTPPDSCPPAPSWMRPAHLVSSRTLHHLASV